MTTVQLLLPYARRTKKFVWKLCIHIFGHFRWRKKELLHIRWNLVILPWVKPQNSLLFKQRMNIFQQAMYTSSLLTLTTGIRAMHASCPPKRVAESVMACITIVVQAATCDPTAVSVSAIHFTKFFKCDACITNSRLFADSSRGIGCGLVSDSPLPRWDVSTVPLIAKCASTNGSTMDNKVSLYMYTCTVQMAEP